jgi:septation ring formation regulator EzrA
MCIFLWSFIVVIGILVILCIFLATASILRKRQDRKKLIAHVKTLRDAGMIHEADMLEKRLIKDGIMKDGSSKA